MMTRWRPVHVFELIWFPVDRLGTPYNCPDRLRYGRAACDHIPLGMGTVEYGKSSCLIPWHFQARFTRQRKSMVILGRRWLPNSCS